MKRENCWQGGTPEFSSVTDQDYSRHQRGTNVPQFLQEEASIEGREYLKHLQRSSPCTKASFGGLESNAQKKTIKKPEVSNTPSWCDSGFKPSSASTLYWYLSAPRLWPPPAQNKVPLRVYAVGLLWVEHWFALLTYANAPYFLRIRNCMINQEELERIFSSVGPEVSVTYSLLSPWFILEWRKRKLALWRSSTSWQMSPKAAFNRERFFIIIIILCDLQCVS